MLLVLVSVIFGSRFFFHCISGRLNVVLFCSFSFHKYIGIIVKKEVPS